MSRFEKILAKVLSGTSDTNVAFADLCSLLEQLGFDQRIRGSHHIFTKDNIEDILNLQPVGSKAKAYQVKQVRTVISKYQLANNEQDDEV